MDSSTGINLRRRGSLVGCLRELDVIVDGERVGGVANAAEKIFPLASGRRGVYVRFPLGVRSRSPRIEVDLAGGGNKVLECGVSARFVLQLLLIPFLAWCLARFIGSGGDIRGAIAVALAAAFLLVIGAAIVQALSGDGVLYLKEAPSSTPLAAQMILETIGIVLLGCLLHQQRSARAAAPGTFDFNRGELRGAVTYNRVCVNDLTGPNPRKPVVQCYANRSAAFVGELNIDKLFARSDRDLREWVSAGTIRVEGRDVPFYQRPKKGVPMDFPNRFLLLLLDDPKTVKSEPHYYYRFQSTLGWARSPRPVFDDISLEEHKRHLEDFFGRLTIGPLPRAANNKIGP